MTPARSSRYWRKWGSRGRSHRNPDISDGHYRASIDGDRYEINPSDPPDDRDHQGDAWGRVTYALFDLVNRHLAGAGVWLYAIDRENELSGIFLTAAQAERARRALPRKRAGRTSPPGSPNGARCSINRRPDRSPRTTREHELQINRI